MTARGPDPFRYTRHPVPDAWWVHVGPGARIGVVRKRPQVKTAVWYGYDLNGKLRCVHYTRRGCAELLNETPKSTSFQGAPT